MKTIEGINCITGKIERVEIQSSKKDNLESIVDKQLPFVGPGLVELQINGIHGIDFNDIALQKEDVLAATQYLLTKGITTFYPTVITNSEANTRKILETIAKACKVYPLVNACVEGIHLEGPFISPEDGARGAHQREYIKPPNWKLVEDFQQITQGRIRLMTLAPEWENAEGFIQVCVKNRIKIAIGHTNATPVQIQKSVAAGASLSTHIGNGIALNLPRHPNILWEQLAQDGLYASMIADGFHVPDSFIKVALRAKRDKLMLVSDATCFSGMEPAVYETHIGNKVVLEKDGRLAIYATPGMLAGATKNLLENIQYLIDKNLTTLAHAWEMSSVIPQKFIDNHSIQENGFYNNDLVLFTNSENGKIKIEKVYKAGEMVFSCN